MLVESCVENYKGIVGEMWSKEEKAQLHAATLEVLLRRGEEFLSVNNNSTGEKGIRWVAWVATAKKGESSVEEKR